MNTGLEYNLALRVRSATRWVEGQQGMLPDDMDGADNSAFGRTMLARTVTTSAPLGESVPSNYSGGSVALRGEIYEGNQSTGVVIWMQGLGGSKLKAGTLYAVRLSGTLTQSITYQGITTPTTRSLYLAITSTVPDQENHYRPIGVWLSETESKIIAERKYYRFATILEGFDGAVIPVYGAPLSAIFNRFQPMLFLRKTGRSVSWSSTEILPIYDWYHVPELIPFRIVILRPGTASQAPMADAPYTNIPVNDPAPVLVYDPKYTSQVNCTCMWSISSWNYNTYYYFPYNSPAENFWIVGKSPDVASSSTLGAPLGSPLGG